LHRVWPDREGNISYLLTMCVDGRARVLDNEDTFQRFVGFLLDSPTRYHWFGRRFVLMPDHVHLIARMGHDAIRLGQWIKALKAVVGGLCPAGPAPPPGVPVGPVPSPGVASHPFIRAARTWRWQDGHHDYKFRTPESETRKWEYVCLNPVRYELVKCPEEWPFGGEIFCDDAGGPRLVRGTPPLLETGILIAEKKTPTP
jgi:REP element-mobilizing transposase RayT